MKNRALAVPSLLLLLSLSLSLFSFSFSALRHRHRTAVKILFFYLLSSYLFAAALSRAPARDLRLLGGDLSARPNSHHRWTPVDHETLD